jgi:DmsE family decaheme c-type cytochrome
MVCLTCEAHEREKNMKRLYRLGVFSAACIGWSMAVVVLAAAQAPAPAQPAPAPALPAGPAKAAVQKDAVCTKCHGATEEHSAMWIYQTRHGNKADARTPGCQNCHGKSDAHLADPGAAPDVVFTAKSKHRSSADVRNASCLTCHETSVLPRTNWSGSVHQVRGVACTDCHNIHAAEQKVLNKLTQAEVCFTCHKAQQAQIHRISAHPLAVTSLANNVKMACSDCHNPHGSTGPKLLVKNSVNETCYTCHPEKRGPFLWEHAPVTDDCTNCHTPHGSANPSLLKARTPWLCQECHSGDHGAQINSGANLAIGNVTTVNGAQQPGAATPRVQASARACLNCHVLVHGSNHPAGAKFQR